MEPESALVASLLGIGGAAYLGIYRAQIREAAHHRWLLAGFVLTVLGTLSSSIAGSVDGDSFSLLATGAFAASTLALCNWSRLCGSMLREERS